MTYLLDTNVCIRYMNGRSPEVLRRLQALHPADVVVCAVVKAELFYGAARSQNPARSLAVQRQFLQPYRSLPFDDGAAEIAGTLRAHLAAQGTPIGPYDVQIAAIALHTGARWYRTTCASLGACPICISRIGKRRNDCSPKRRKRTMKPESIHEPGGKLMDAAEVWEDVQQIAGILQRNQANAEPVVRLQIPLSVFVSAHRQYLELTYHEKTACWLMIERVHALLRQDHSTACQSPFYIHICSDNGSELPHTNMRLTPCYVHPCSTKVMQSVTVQY